MDFIDLNNKVIVISGASSGIGRQIVIQCAELGAKLILLGRNQEELSKTIKLLPTTGHIAKSIDLTNFDEIEPMISDCVQKIGKISGFCHSAGIEYTLPLRSMTIRHYQEQFAINTIAAFELSRVISKKAYMQNEGGSFVFIASIMGVVGRPGLTGYSASKGALIAGAKSMALELAPKKIRVNCISPGTIMTNLIENMLNNLEAEQRNKRLGDFPLGIGEPQDVANLAAFLLSDRSKWITGANIIIDGGYTAK
ncbi:MAG TPA: SDR family oxidoreductase [Candidatus Cloacimonadota bacterium]|nr:SDR family oxidoreductase [Candidatus Cloacimonadota bacterium]HQL14409.1 SDR family oxidoreductase [Candidatus Cloacimonadota bacterium]